MGDESTGARRLFWLTVGVLLAALTIGCGPALRAEDERARSATGCGEQRD